MQAPFKILDLKKKKVTNQKTKIEIGKVVLSPGIHSFCLNTGFDLYDLDFLGVV